MEPDFHPDVRRQHRRIDPDSWRNVYVVGDVHGCLEPLEELLASLSVTERDLVVFVGDLVRKGPNSTGVIELVRSRPNMVSVRGNNEEKLVRGEKTLPALSAAELEWLRSLPVAISWPGGLVVHGGVDPHTPLSEHTVEDLQTTRSLEPGGGYDGPFWYEEHDGPPRVFFGHTVLEEPLVSEWAVGLDTGCVYGGSLTAFDLDAGETHRVLTRHTEVTRKDSKIVSTFEI